MSNAERSIYDDLIDKELFDDYGTVYCPSVNCGVHLSNGMSVHDAAEEKMFHHRKYMFCCLGCSQEFGPAIDSTKPSKPIKPGKAHPKDMSLRAKVLAFLDERPEDMTTAARVKLVASVFDITSANARYYVTRVWIGEQ